MIIHTEGKLKRVFIYTDAGRDDYTEEPAMALYRPGIKGKCAIIPLSCAYKYDEPEHRQEQAAVMSSCMDIAMILDYPLTEKSAALIAATVQDGLDELIKMPPKERKEFDIGEAIVGINGVNTTVPVKI